MDPQMVMSVLNSPDCDDTDGEGRRNQQNNHRHDQTCNFRKKAKIAIQFCIVVIFMLQFLNLIQTTIQTEGDVSVVLRTVTKLMNNTLGVWRDTKSWHDPGPSVAASVADQDAAG